MKISTEQAFDLLPNVVDIYEKTNVEGYIEQVRKKNKGKKVDQMMAGIDLFKFVFKNIHKAKDEVFEVVAIVEDKDVEEVKEQPVFETFATFKKIFQNEELMGFFKSAMQ